MTTQDKSGLFGFGLGMILAFAIIYIIERDKDKEESKQPPINDESIRVAVESYQGAMTDKQPQASLDEINRQLSDEFGLTVEYKPLANKFYVRDRSGRKVKEV